ncbi:hypothetical protein ACHAXT_012648 [Thalassiosira profunda]
MAGRPRRSEELTMTLPITRSAALGRSAGLAWSSRAGRGGRRSARPPPQSSLFPAHHETRDMSTTAEGDETAPFDRAAKLRQRARAAEACRQFYRRHLQSRPQDGDDTKPVLPYDYFHREVAQRLVERLDDINVRDEGFPLALEVGAGAEFVYDALVDGCDDDLMLELDDEENEYVGGRGGVRKLVQMDACKAMLHRDDAFANKTSGDGEEKSTICETYKLEADLDEAPLPFPEGTFDLVVSSMALHWINDLPRLLSEIKRVLKPDGCFLFALPGGNTLPELRSSLVLAELEREGGVSTHVGPYVDLSNVGSLLTGTGFRLPTIDIDDIHVGYPNAMVLMEHLARMGEGNASANRKDRVGLGTFLGAACLYRELYPAEEGKSGEGIVASAQVIYGIAWKEHESQQRPLDRGSATQSMADIAVTQTTGSE